jgi:hypothetical protein
LEKIQADDYFKKNLGEIEGLEIERLEVERDKIEGVESNGVEIEEVRKKDSISSQCGLESGKAD